MVDFCTMAKDPKFGHDITLATLFLMVLLGSVLMKCFQIFFDWAVAVGILK
jgi:hypothetical protein